MNYYTLSLTYQDVILLPEVYLNKAIVFTATAARTFEAVVNNATLSNVQRFHYFIALLKNEAKDLISNLQITSENFLVAWQLVTQRYNNTRLIAMMYAKHLCQMSQVKKGDASSLRQLTMCQAT